MTGLVTEALKKIFDEQKWDYSKNILAGTVAVVVALFIGLGYVGLTHTPLSGDVVIYIIGLIILSWLCAMDGYDKVVQTIKQLTGGITNDKGNNSGTGV